jgi:arylsulfatase A-like enzyme
MIATSEDASQAPESGRWPGPIDLLVLSAWCGLTAGDLEVFARVLGAHLSFAQRMYAMPRHFVWLVPLINLSLFVGVGLILSAAKSIWPRRVGWFSLRLFGAFAVLPALMVVGHQVFALAWLMVSIGIASLLAPAIERHAAGMRRWLPLSFPVVAGAVLVQAGLIFGDNQLRAWHEEHSPLPPAGSPNVLLVVLDTVRADHLSLYGYERPTSPALMRLASRGVRFERARASAPWTLASHATMFTGRWPHDLDIQWLHPLRGDVPTLAEFLGGRGYATAGFVGNTLYCSYDSGLGRGFTHYEDYVLDTMTAVRTAQLSDALVSALVHINLAAIRTFPRSALRRLQEQMARLLSPDDRKDARIINREFLDWLSRRQEPGRPFFAFLNYMDAHSPYVLPWGSSYRFGLAPATEADLLFLTESWPHVDKLRVSPRERTLARDSYDNCLAYLDERLGELFDELERQGVLDQTIVIVTADHGEGLGEHNLFDHGESLYRPEIRVPLLIVQPSSGRTRGLVDEAVSLREIPATVAELVGAGAKSPFPGRSLTRLWGQPPVLAAAPGAGHWVLSELSAPNPRDPNQGRSPAHRGPLFSLVMGDFVYIRHQKNRKEELFDEREDPGELKNRAHDEAMLPVVQRFRDQLDQLTPSVERGPKKTGSPSND